MMEYRPLGRTGVQVSRLCLGAMTFGGKTDQAEATHMVDRFLDAGGNFIDTANVYQRGVSEEMTGRALVGGKREHVVLATKGLRQDSERNRAVACVSLPWLGPDGAYAACSTAHTSPHRSWKSRH